MLGQVVQQELQQSTEDALRAQTVYSQQSCTGFCYDDRMLDHEVCCLLCARPNPKP